MLAHRGGDRGSTWPTSLQRGSCEGELGVRTVNDPSIQSLGKERWGASEVWEERKASKGIANKSRRKFQQGMYD